MENSISDWQLPPYSIDDAAFSCNVYNELNLVSRDSRTKRISAFLVANPVALNDCIPAPTNIPWFNFVVGVKNVSSFGPGQFRSEVG